MRLAKLKRIGEISTDLKQKISTQRTRILGGFAFSKVTGAAGGAAEGGAGGAGAVRGSGLTVEKTNRSQIATKTHPTMVQIL